MCPHGPAQLGSARVLGPIFISLECFPGVLRLCAPHGQSGKRQRCKLWLLCLSVLLSDWNGARRVCLHRIIKQHPCVHASVRRVYSTSALSAPWVWNKWIIDSFHVSVSWDIALKNIHSWHLIIQKWFIFNLPVHVHGLIQAGVIDMFWVFCTTNFFCLNKQYIVIA